VKNIARTTEEYQQYYKKSVESPEVFWEEVAESFVWKKKWDSVLEWDFNKPVVKWFDGATLNITENCLDRHLRERGNKTAILWEPNEPDDSAIKLTYEELHSKVCSFANMLKNKGVGKGDRVCIYMPMVPELAIATLACARIGAIHSIVFAGFSSLSLENRINDSTCKMVITSDGLYRGTKTLCLKDIVDDALENCSCIETVLVLNRTGEGIFMKEGRDYWIKEELKTVNDICPAEEMKAEDPLFILYTSGSTGKPKGMVHTCGGYMVYTAYSFKSVFQYEEEDIYWCTADIGWITGHSYIVYGPLGVGATTVMFEGVPTYPDAGRFWEICEKHKVSIFYTAPTAIRALAKCNLELVKKQDLSSLKTLGTVGEPINEEAWHWYNDNIGSVNIPIVDTWWQTETGGIMISPLAGITESIPTFATLPLPGIQPALFSKEGEELNDPVAEGRLCIKFPWPSIARTIYGDHKRYKETYFSSFPGNYFSGDGCKRDVNGNYRITGRVDDVVIVSGHNLGTAEIENAINAHPNIAESAVVGFPHDLKGNAIFAYVSIKGAIDYSTILIELRDLVSHKIGGIAKPEKIVICSGLPKTRSGKIMRRILRKIAAGEGENLGDISTLLNPEVVEEIKGLV